MAPKPQKEPSWIGGPTSSQIEYDFLHLISTIGLNKC